MARPEAPAAHGAGTAAPARRRLTQRSRALRILHVNDLGLHEGGGAEVYISRLRDAQVAGGDDVRVLAGAVRHTGMRRVLDLWDPSAARLLADTIRRVTPDVVHLHNIVRELSPSVLVACRDVPTVLTAHDLRAFGAGEHHLPDPRGATDRVVTGPLVRRLVRRHVDAVIAVSATVGREARRAGLDRVVTVPVPAPHPVAAPVAPSACHDVAAAATLAPDKGIDVLVDAFLRVADRHPAARLVVAGDGPARAALQDRAAPLGDRAVFPGRLEQHELSGVFACARVVVVPSRPDLRREGASLTAAEAARHGRPVITSDDPAAAEVGRSVGGEVVPAGDPQALADALDRLLADGALADDMGARAARLATVYDVERVAAEVREVYADVVR